MEKRIITFSMGLSMDLINYNLLHKYVNDVVVVGNNTDGFIDEHKSIRES